MVDTIASRQPLALPPHDEGEVPLQAANDGTDVRGIAWTAVAYQVEVTADHLNGVTVVEEDTVTHQDEEGVDVTYEEVIAVGTLQETGDVGNPEGMA